jgi:putative transposase
MRLADFSTNGSIHFICMDWRHISELLEAAAKPECLRKVILFGERSLRQALKEYIEHYHAERNHQGKGNVLLFPRHRAGDCERPVQCRKRLGGLLRYYHQEAA